MSGRLHAFRTTLTAVALLVFLGGAVPAISQESSKATGPPYRVGGEISRPEILSSTHPVYTELARRARVTGTVIVEAVIDEQGNVTDIRVLKGLPMGLDRAAVEAIKEWRFKPATLQGKPVSVYYVLTVNFQVDDAPFSEGPMFLKFLEQNPEFATHLRAKRYQEATDLLDRWAVERPADPAIALARIHLLLEGDQLQEAWQRAQEDHGPGRYESLCSVGAFAWRQGQMWDAAGRAEAIELGLQAETAAMATKEDGMEAFRAKSWLLQLKAGLARDPGERQALMEEAKQLLEHAAKLQTARDAGSKHQP